MAPFEALCGRKCRTPLNWVESGERRYYGINFVNEAEQQVRTIQQHLKLLRLNKRVMLCSQGSFVPQSVSDERGAKVQSQAKACTLLCTTLSDSRKEREGSLQDPATG